MAAVTADHRVCPIQINRGQETGAAGVGGARAGGAGVERGAGVGAGE